MGGLVIKQKPCFSEVCHQKLEMHLIMLIIILRFHDRVEGQAVYL